jgi:hypothetical protein
MSEDPLSNTDDLRHVAHAYFARLTSQPVPSSLERHAPFVAPRRTSRVPRLITSLVAFVLLAAVVLLISVRIGEELSNRQRASTTPTPSATSTIAPPASAPPGGPVPTTLAGDWILRTTTPSTSPDLIFQGNRYQLVTSGGFSFGNVAVNGNEIDFFNGSVCRIPLPGGVGRYRWSLHNGVLQFTPLNADPCGGRTRPLANQTYVRQHG